MSDPKAQRIPLPDGSSLSALVTTPVGGQRARAALILAHGAGGDMDEASLAGVHAAAAALGYVAVRFRFPYREAGRKGPDSAPRLEAAFRGVAAWVRQELVPGVERLVVGGKSMGGRIASLMAATGEPVDGLLFLGYPLHAAGKPDKLRDAHLYVIRRPMLFVQGARDSLCRIEQLEPVLGRIGAMASLHVVADADHSFKVRKSSGRSVDEARAEVVEVASAWLRRLL